MKKDEIRVSEKHGLNPSITHIVIKSMSIVNFKGIRRLDISFGKETFIRGANGTGKTTVFDAFTWLLFGKDSSGRTKFNIKTLDERGEPIPQLPHEVSAVLNVDGRDISLRRCWTEVWSAYRGSREKSFDHNEGERYYNEVPCSEKEFKEKIDAICSESRFRELTDPFFFNSQSKEYQRHALLAMVGDVSLEDVTSADSTLAAISDRLTGKTIEEFEREVAFHKKRVKSSIADIEPRLDEQKRDLSSLPESDWDAISSRIRECKRLIADADSQIADIGKAYDAASAERGKIAFEIATLKTRITERKLELRETLLSDYYKQRDEYHAAAMAIHSYNDEQKRRERDILAKSDAASSELRRLQDERVRLEGERQKLLGKYRELMAQTFDESSAVCPACHRPYEDSKREQLESVWYDARNTAIEDNKRQGLAVRQRIESCDRATSDTKDLILRLKEELESINYKSSESLVAPTEPVVTDEIESDKVIKDIDSRINELSALLDRDVAPAETTESMERKKALESEVDSLLKKLVVRDEISRTRERIAELEKALTTCRSELEEDIEMERLIFAYNKARMDILQSRINALFKYVTFRMYYKQANGELAETCECLVDGVPFMDMNNAACINAGIDIINAISKVYGETAPIFIDNRESVTHIIDTDAQVINLVVDGSCKELIAEQF